MDSLIKPIRLSHVSTQSVNSSGLFFAMGLGFTYCLIDLPNKLLLFRFLLLGLFIGRIARIVGWVALGITEKTIGAVLIKLVFPPIMLFLQRNTSRADNASL